jgi:hypothetical protein
MFKIFLITLAFLPSLLSGIPLTDPYSDIENPGLHAFLTEPFKPVTNIKQLPAGLILRLEQSSLNDADGLLDEFTERKHFKYFKMDMAGQSDQYFYICYQTGKAMPFNHLFVFVKDKKKNTNCFKQQITEPKYYGGTLKGLRELVVGDYRKEQKRKLAAAQWRGNLKNGWVNAKTQMRLMISDDGKSLVAKDGMGKILWVSNVSSMWAGYGKSGPFPGKLYPRRITWVEFDEDRIHVSWNRCGGEIDVKTGVFHFMGCD